MSLKKYILLILLISSLKSQLNLWNFELLWEKGVCDFNSIDSLGGFGNSLAGADVNQDGFSDLIISSLPWNIVVPETLIFFGKVYIFFGGPLLDTTPDIVIENPKPDTEQLGKYFGISIATGDFNEDGYIDLIVGNDADTTGPSMGGTAYLYLGIPGGVSTQPSMIFSEAGARGYAHSIANAGDINGDGYDDIIIGAPYTDPEDRGAVYIYYGGPLLDTIPDFVRYGKPLWQFGWSVTGLGDINDDGYGDFAVTAYDWPQFPGPNAIIVFYGGNPPDTLWDIFIPGEGIEQGFGNKIKKAKFDYDNKFELITGAMYYPYSMGSPEAPGKIYVYFGENMDSIPDWTVIGYRDSAQLGSDVDGIYVERYGIIGGAPNSTPWSSFLFYFGYPDMDIFYDAMGFVDSCSMGFCVASAGDVDGDGKDEILVSDFFTVPESLRGVWLLKYTGPIPSVEEPSLPDIEKYIAINPNPFNKFINIKISLPEKEYIDLSIYDVSGRKVHTIFKEEIKRLKIKWKAKDIKSGVYFIKLESPSFKFFKKILYLQGVDDV